MIVSIWVFFMLGDPFATEHGTPYVQRTASSIVHDMEPARELVEETAHQEFASRYPGHVVTDSGWRKQDVTVNRV